jgi:uncharacterized protein with PIN domain
MLGGLARWLRILGHETEYDSAIDDNRLLERSQEKDAVLLTRDEELHNRATAKGVKSVLVQGETEQVRLAQLAKTLGIFLEIDVANTRCPSCGSVLRKISKEEAVGSVPSSSLTLYEQFWKCAGTGCGKTYWVGSHWKRIRQTLADARKSSSK